MTTPTAAWWTRSPDASAADAVPSPAPGSRITDPTVLLHPRPPVRAHRRPRSGGAIALGLVGVLVIGAAGGTALLLGFLLRPDPAPPDQASRASSVTFPVDPATITATASSTQQAQGDTDYDAANTLDGDPATAWNSDGTRHPSGRGIVLTYRFTEPIVLADLTVRNGYQKVRSRPDRSTLDLYSANQRVRRVKVVTDAGSWTWELADTRAPQTFTRAPGRTRSVRLEIISGYPSTAYRDIALSEVSFTATVPG